MFGQINHKLASMKHLTYCAAADLLEIIRLSQFAALATWTETMDRLVALCAMCSPKNPSRRTAERILSVNEWPKEDDWADGEITFDSNEQGQTTLRPGGGNGSDLDDEHDLLNLYPGPYTGLAKWEFRPLDADPYPSVPHGHWEGRDRPKLDPYQGWVYDRTRQLRREPKKKITALWNDHVFRKFALGTISFHLEHFPYHGDWRVKNPLRLPRRR